MPPPPASTFVLAPSLSLQQQDGCVKPCWQQPQACSDTSGVTHLHCCVIVAAAVCPASLVQAVKSAKAAEVEVSKLNYRILHLTRSLRAAEQ
jgi:hypothetical protein